MDENKGFKIIKRKTSPREEQETIIQYDVDTKEWLFYTSYPVHARKWEDYIIPSSNFGNNIKVYNEDTDNIIEISGKIDGTASLNKRREYTQAERDRMAEIARKRFGHDK